MSGHECSAHSREDQLWAATLCGQSFGSSGDSLQIVSEERDNPEQELHGWLAGEDAWCYGSSDKTGQQSSHIVPIPVVFRPAAVRDVQETADERLMELREVSSVLPS